jgi:hypothetical protein
MTAPTDSSIGHPGHRARARPGRTPVRATTVLLVTLILGVVVSVVGSGPASAAEEAQTPHGWARVAHLSPDTRSVDVALTAVAGGQILFDLKDVAYGDVSDYLRLPVGAYVVDMTPTGSTENSTPALSQLITVKADQPLTLAVLGTSADLTAKVVSDDLTPPADGQARVRVLQASTVAETVEIQTSMGMTIAAGTKSGEVTGYATVQDGPWDLQLFADARKSQASIDLASGSVNTLLVLDNASGGLTVKVIPDSGSVTDTPVGGTNTGAAPSGSSPFETAPGGSSTIDDVVGTSWPAVLSVVAGVGVILVVALGAPERLLPALGRRRR